MLLSVFDFPGRPELAVASSFPGRRLIRIDDVPEWAAEVVQRIKADVLSGRGVVLDSGETVAAAAGIAT